jgi:hypothetical protein
VLHGGAVTGKSLFQTFAENLLGAMDRYGVACRGTS